MAPDIAQFIWLVVLGIYLVLSVATFVVYGADKRAAVAGRWRTTESTLLVLGLLGGWPGGALAQQVFRHKRRKGSFQLKFWLSVAANLAVLVLLVWSAGIF